MGSFEEKTTKGTYKTVSIPIAAATLSYARIHMAKLMTDILNRGGLRGVPFNEVKFIIQILIV